MLHPAAIFHIFGYLWFIAGVIVFFLIMKEKSIPQYLAKALIGPMWTAGINKDLVILPFGLVAITIGAALLPANGEVFLPVALRDGLVYIQYSFLLFLAFFITPRFSLYQGIILTNHEANPVMKSGRIIKYIAILIMIWAFLDRYDNNLSSTLNEQGWGLLAFFGYHPKLKGMILSIGILIYYVSISIEIYGYQVRQQTRELDASIRLIKKLKNQIDEITTEERDDRAGS